MYTINQTPTGKFACSLTIQDGTERWERDTLEEAVTSVITAARVMNGTYLLREEVTISQCPECGYQPGDPGEHSDYSCKLGMSSSVKVVPTCTESERKLLDSINTGHKVVLDANDTRIKYRITTYECETILQLREGKLFLTQR